MAQDKAPSRPRRDPMHQQDREGRQGHGIGGMGAGGELPLEEMWRQVVAGFVTVPCEITNVGDVYTLTPRLHEEGARSYGEGMIWAGVASATSTGTVTAKVVSSEGRELETVPVFKSNGAAAAGAGDVVSGGFYLWCYVASLSGLVLK